MVANRNIKVNRTTQLFASNRDYLLDVYSAVRPNTFFNVSPQNGTKVACNKISTKVSIDHTT